VSAKRETPSQGRAGTMPQFTEIIENLLKTFESAHEDRRIINVLQLLMLKYLNDSDAAQKSAHNPRTHYHLPECARWDSIKGQETDFFETIPHALAEIERNNATLEGVLLPESFRRHPFLKIEHAIDLLIQAPPLFASKAEQIQIIDIIENAENEFAKQQSRYANRSTPPEISNLLVSLIDPKNGESVYDPFAGTGQLLCRSAKHIHAKQASSTEYTLAGQEINPTTWAIAKMKLILGGEENADLALGNVLSDPAHHTNKILKKFDCVISNPPLGLNWKVDRELAIDDPYGRFERGLPPASGGDLAIISHMLASLSQSGRLGVVTNRGTMHRFDSSIRQRLTEEDLLECIINLPSNLLPNTKIPISIIIFNNKKSTGDVGKVFLINAAHIINKTKKSSRKIIDQNELNKILKTYHEKLEIPGFSTYVNTKELIDNKNDWSVHRYVSPAKLKIQEMVRVYDQFKSHQIHEILTRLSGKDLINFFTSKLEDKFHTLIIMPKMQQIDSSKWRIFSSYEEFRIEFLELYEKRQYNMDVYTVSDSVVPDYLKIFFGTDLGKLILEDAKIDSAMNAINHDAYKSTEIPIPDLNTQNRIIEKFQSFEKITFEIQKMRSEFSVNPVSNAYAAKLHHLLEITEQLTQSDKIRNQVQVGETKTQEFKQTLEYCLREKKKADYVLRSALKTVAGFLNTQGGTLFVGVEDGGGIPGVNFELDKFHRGSEDQMILHLTNKIKSDLGSDALQYVDKEIHEVDGNLVLVVECAPSKTPVFYKKEQFFVRRPASTDELKGEDQMKYYAQRFRSST